jgi:hypothetical protein
MPRKSWAEKFASPQAREVKVAPKKFADIAAGQMMLLTTPRDVADALTAIPRGTAIDIKALRSDLATRWGAEIACPVVTGIHLRTIAELTGEQLDAGLPASAVVPVWRIVGPHLAIWDKLENGRDHFLALRNEEGIETAARPKRKRP